jgi:CBS domain containing-hemolysin-like protein
MTDWVMVLFVAGGVLGLIFSALFSGIETGLYTINRVRLSVRAGHGDLRGKYLLALIQNPVRMLATLLVANNIANYAASYCMAGILDRLKFSPVQAIALNVVVMVPLLFVFGEVLPKDLFRTHTDRWTYVFARFLEIVRRLLTWTGLVPLVELIGRVAARVLRSDTTTAATARQRMSVLIKEGMGAGVLTEAQTTLADRALSLRERTVQSVMVPWKSMLCIAPDADQKARELHIRYRTHTRLPVVDKDGKVIGILSLLDALLDQGKSTRDLMQPPLNLAPDVSVREALRRMREARQTIAIVVQPAKGAPLGMVTIKDLIEPLTGKLAAW